MRVLLATNNHHKRIELAAILHESHVTGPGDWGIDAEVDETGTTFLENAMLKARAIRAELVRIAPRDAHEVIVVADDSGLCVDALEGGPGIYSARFGSPDGGRTELDAATRNRLLLDSLTGETNRSARFICCMVAILSADRIVVAQESWEGSIAEQPSSATGGFGYDPIFTVPDRGCTAADLPPSVKNSISHRGRAAAVLGASLRAAIAIGA
ncbi:MAG: non-canonical purine NTP pyrophosphatase [Spirochaetaceae bacterium]|nr:MAG: non-canonical purine NTP pyrophosphatase [Spirochaetaceae bacterium]